MQVYEGMAKWVEIQYAYLINEHAVAKREEIITAYRKDEYGFGFLRYRSNYILSTENIIIGLTPFSNVDRYVKRINDISLYEEGLKLSKTLKKQLQDFEKKIEALNKDDE